MNIKTFLSKFKYYLLFVIAVLGFKVYNDYNGQSFWQPTNNATRTARVGNTLYHK